MFCHSVSYFFFFLGLASDPFERPEARVLTVDAQLSTDETSLDRRRRFNRERLALLLDPKLRPPKLSPSSLMPSLMSSMMPVITFICHWMLAEYVRFGLPYSRSSCPWYGSPSMTKALISGSSFSASIAAASFLRFSSSVALFVPQQKKRFAMACVDASCSSSTSICRVLGTTSLRTSRSVCRIRSSMSSSSLLSLNPLIISAAMMSMPEVATANNSSDDNMVMTNCV
mmetsp:Transcript_14847/g.31889  ORF Transcript_14847/g.31889 Transcript_14847/m.31889 type:complete len:228 (-) Transcript_14847:2278-2961(-)